MGQILGQHRGSLSAAFVRAQAACLTSRMGHMGVGAGEDSCHAAGGEAPEGGGGALLHLHAREGRVELEEIDSRMEFILKIIYPLLGP